MTCSKLGYLFLLACFGCGPTKNPVESPPQSPPTTPRVAQQPKPSVQITVVFSFAVFKGGVVTECHDLYDFGPLQNREYFDVSTDGSIIENIEAPCLETFDFVTYAMCNRGIGSQKRIQSYYYIPLEKWVSVPGSDCRNPGDLWWDSDYGGYIWEP